jgi:hypothetical protein
MSLSLQQLVNESKPKKVKVVLNKEEEQLLKKIEFRSVIDGYFN